MIYFNISNTLSHFGLRIFSFQTAFIISFVVISNAGIERVDISYIDL